MQGPGAHPGGGVAPWAAGRPQRGASGSRRGAKGSQSPPPAALAVQGPAAVEAALWHPTRAIPHGRRGATERPAREGSRSRAETFFAKICEAILAHLFLWSGIRDHFRGRL